MLYPNLLTSFWGTGSDYSELKASDPLWLKNMQENLGWTKTGTELRAELASGPRQSAGVGSALSIQVRRAPWGCQLQGRDEQWPPEYTAVTTCVSNEGLGESKGTWTRTCPFHGESQHRLRQGLGCSTGRTRCTPWSLCLASACKSWWLLFLQVYLFLLW